MSGIAAKYPRLVEELKKYPRPDKVLKYGTAGFREKADILDSTFFRAGMLALLRSRQLEKTIGLMVTASHNAEPDNGIKMVDPDGGMLDASWEQYAADLANTPAEEVPALMDKIIAAENINIDRFGSVFIGKDTRPTSEHLSELAREGALLIGGNVLDFGLQTTPQLHHIVRMFNIQKSEWASEEGYYNMLAEAYQKILYGQDPKVEDRGKVICDAANGVGGAKMVKMAEKLSKEIKCEVRNAGDGTLNHMCGAEHCQKARLPPAGVDAGADKNVRIFSFDGDADRVVYHYFDDSGTWKLIDGDKIAALIAGFLKENLAVLGLDNEFKMAAVQTAYANGASTNYIRGLGVDVPIAKTGVKFVHHKAMEYDIGLYFEANGHGTVTFKDHVIKRLEEEEAKATEEPKKEAATKLVAATQLINQAVGDAISDALTCEAILTIKGWSVQDWDKIYADLPSRQTKIQVKDRTIVTVTDDETKVIEPAALQTAIDAAVGNYAGGRAFARPSGTEDVVRVYAEANSQADADKLALEVANAIFTHAQGVGDAPTSFTA